MAEPLADRWDVIVIGSGMGGMTTAAALSRLEHRVLLLEQAQTIGGLTHSFTRNGFTWDVGLHYCGTFGRNQNTGRILDWLSGGTIEFRSIGTVYDTLHFPDGFELSVCRPAFGSRSRRIVAFDSGAFSPNSPRMASSKSPSASPCRYSSGSRAPTSFVRRANSGKTLLSRTALPGHGPAASEP